MLSMQDEVRLNQYAQGVRLIDDGLAWFEALDGGRRVDVLHGLATAIQQAHPQSDEIAAAISKAGLKRTHTPSVLLSGGSFTAQAAKVVALPEAEQKKSFLLFVALLGIADARRKRADCAGGCSHWWHQDLADDLAVRRILNRA